MTHVDNCALRYSSRGICHCPDADREAVTAFATAASLVQVLHQAGQPINVDLWLTAIREQVEAGVRA